MPGIDGVEATRRIMGESPCAILVVTATVSGHLSKVYQAMGYGALDAIDTPTLGPRGEISGAAMLLHKIEMIGRLVGKPDRPARARSGVNTASVVRGRLPSRSSRSLDPLVVLGASTGGPQALAEILGRLPAAARGRDHHRAARRRGVRARAGTVALRAGAAARDADRAEGHRPAAGEVLLSVTDDHLVLGEDRRLHYSPEPRSACYRPSVDVFFDSVARNWPRPGVAVLLDRHVPRRRPGDARPPPPGLANHRPGRVVQRGLGHAQGRRRDRRRRGGPATSTRSPRGSPGWLRARS